MKKVDKAAENRLIREAAARFNVSEQEAARRLAWCARALQAIEMVTDSPIERQFLEGLIDESLGKLDAVAIGRAPAGGVGPSADNDRWVIVRGDGDVFCFGNPDKPGCSLMLVATQAPIGPYRADLLVWVQVDGLRVSPMLVVECDGHDYHERTKEQAEHDRRRDRFMAALPNAIVFRFTGSEIHRDKRACAREAIALLNRRI